MRNRVVWLTALLLAGFMGFNSSHAQENLLTNGGFEEGTAMPFNTWAALTWNIYANSPGAGDGEVVSELTGAEVPDTPIEGQYCLHVTVLTAGTNFWDVGLQHGGHTFQAGKKYTLSLFLKSKQGTAQVNIKPELGQDPYTGYGERSITITNEWAEYSVTTPTFASNVTPGNLTFHIGYAACDFWVDCVRFYEGDYVPPALGPKPKARKPNPADGAIGVAMPLLQWTAGDTAEWHDVYLGSTPTLGPANKVARSIKLVPMYYHVPGFVPGQTYYWRVDEVETDGVTVHTGDVWSFTAAPNTAYSPTPLNGARWIAPAGLALSWLPGAGAQSHDVYFGTNKADVEAGTGGTSKGNQSNLSYKPAALAENTTYYWRVDERASGGVTYKGTTWNFTTLKPGGGAKAQYFKGMNLGGTPVVTRVDSSINFNWGDPGSPDPLVPNDNFSARWTADLEVAFTGKYTFSTITDDGVRLWVGGQLLVDEWIEQGATEWSGTIDLVGGQTYPLVMEYYENTGGAVAQLYWQGPNTARQIIPAGPLQLPVKASGPRPGNGATDIQQSPTLEWNAGDKAAKHDVFFGTDETAVANATTTTTGIYKGRQDRAATSYSPGTLEWNTTYYWKVDEVNTASAESPWKGSLWSFTTADFVVVDDFEDYSNLSPHRVFQTWIDGLGYNEPAPGNPGNGSGAIVGHDIWTPTSPYYNGSIVETAIIHGGGQSMPMDYNNIDSPYYSETARTFTPAASWTANGLKALTLWFRGNSPKFVQSGATYTIGAAGADIWGASDEFRYVYKQLSGDGEIVARVDEISGAGTNEWRKAGVMIRATLDPTALNVCMAVTPTASHGLAFQYRHEAGDSDGENGIDNVTAPYWVKLVRKGNDFTAYHSPDGVTWTKKDPSGNETDALNTNPVTITMPANVYIGLAVTSHEAGVMTVAEFSNVSTTATGTWRVADVGVAQPGNSPEQLYVAVDGAVVKYSDPAATNLATWTEWNIPLKTLSDAGVNLNSVKKMSIGVGDRNFPTKGGSGSLYIDDIRLYKPRCMPDLAKPKADFSSNCVVDYADLEIIVNNWLIQNYTVTPANPGTSGLVAYYVLSNTVQDGSGKAHHGTVRGAPTYIPGPAGYGTAMNFSGAGNYVDLGTFNPSAATGKITVALWAKWNGLNAFWQGLIGKRDTWAAADMMWQIEANQTNGTLGFFREGSYPDDGDPVLPVGEWAHVAATFDGTTATFYLNGEKTGSGAFSFGSDAAASVQFGACEANGNNPFNGALDEVRIYDRALSQGEVGWLAGKSAVYTQPLYWLLTPQDGAIDLTGDGAINLKDFAALMSVWLEEQLWP